MSEPALSNAPQGDTERLLTFEFAQAMYALPIAEVHEVAEAKRICCVPTIPVAEVGVMNWHGEALPVVSAGLLLGVEPLENETEEDADPAALETEEETMPRAVRATHVLVVSGRDDEPARLGLPIDRVLGIVDGPRLRRGSQHVVVERRPIEGRIVNVLCPRSLVACATEVIGRQLA